jgi:tetratricopeptide (TPR) repeat protein
MTDSIIKKTQSDLRRPNDWQLPSALDYSFSFALDFGEGRENAFRAFVVLRENEFKVEQPTQDTHGWHVPITLSLFGDQELFEQIEQIDRIANKFDAVYCHTSEDQENLKASIVEMEKSAARLAMSNGMFDVCIRKVEKLLQSGQFQPLEGFQLIGQANMRAGRLSDAVIAFQKLLGHCHDARQRGETQCLLADCFAAESDYAKAEEYWIESLATPSIHEAHYGLARCRARIGHSKQAIHWLKMACQAVPAFREKAATEPDFAKIAQSPEFRRFICPSFVDKLCSRIKKAFRRQNDSAEQS